MAKKSNDPLADILTMIFKGLGSLIKLSYHAVKRLVTGKKAVSKKQQALLELEFQKIAFKDKSGNFPKLVHYVYDKDKKAHEYIFYSSIPREEWSKNILQLNTALDKNIHDISEYGSKQKVRVVAFDNTVRLPENIQFSLDAFIDDDFTFVLGEDYGGMAQFNINDSPHILFAGGTGSGKSVALQLVVGQAILKGWHLDFIDFKRVEFNSDFKRYGEIANDMDLAKSIMEKHFKENEARMTLFEEQGVRNIQEYNSKFPTSKLAYSAVVIDEIAELLDAPKEINAELVSMISSIARLGRAQGVFIFMAMQRPEAKLLSGQIRDMMNVRLCGYFTNSEAYRMVLGSEGSNIRARDYERQGHYQDKKTDAGNGKRKKNVQSIDTKKKDNIKGRFAFLAGASVEMIQVFYYHPRMIVDHEYRMNGRLALDKKSTSFPVDKKLKTVTVDAKKRVPQAKVQERDDDGSIEFIFDYSDLEMERSDAD